MARVCVPCLHLGDIVGLLVYISHHSVTVTKLLGSSPVPVLATLFLLSYAKLLRIMIAVLSLTTLHYPDKDIVVWIHDANVSLAKYIPLILVALLFLLFLFLPYTLLLLLGQWLQPIGCSHWPRRSSRVYGRKRKSKKRRATNIRGMYFAKDTFASWIQTTISLSG